MCFSDMECHTAITFSIDKSPKQKIIILDSKGLIVQWKNQKKTALILQKFVDLSCLFLQQHL